eukprot:11166533-Lingulodinium_polyedra.AAC.1
MAARARGRRGPDAAWLGRQGHAMRRDRNDAQLGEPRTPVHGPDRRNVASWQGPTGRAPAGRLVGGS